MFFLALAQLLKHEICYVSIVKNVFKPGFICRENSVQMNI